MRAPSGIPVEATKACASPVHQVVAQKLVAPPVHQVVVSKPAAPPVPQAVAVVALSDAFRSKTMTQVDTSGDCSVPMQAVVSRRNPTRMRPLGVC